MKSLPDWQRPLPHVRAGIKQKNISGNPVFAREMLQFVKNEDKCKIGTSIDFNFCLQNVDSAVKFCLHFCAICAKLDYRLMHKILFSSVWNASG